jgi:hypothetical protein
MLKEELAKPDSIDVNIKLPVDKLASPKPDPVIITQ